MSLYSVFVGNLNPTVTQDDLSKLFSGCGLIEDLVILPSETPGRYNYGFVRYSEVDSAMKAVSELHRWILKGTRIIVDLSVQTRERIQKENKSQEGIQIKKVGKPTKTGPASPDTTSSLIQDVMYMGRLKETCTTLNLEIVKHNTGAKTEHFAGQQKVTSLDTVKLLDDIAEAARRKPQRFNGKLLEEASANKVYEKLMISNSAEPELREAQGKEFIHAMNTVMNNMQDFLKATLPEDEPSNAGEFASQYFTSVSTEDLTDSKYLDNRSHNDCSHPLDVDSSHDQSSVDNSNSHAIVDNSHHSNVSHLHMMTLGKLQRHLSTDDERGSNSSTSDENEYFNGDSGVETDLNGSKDSQYGERLREILNPSHHQTNRKVIRSPTALSSIQDPVTNSSGLEQNKTVFCETNSKLCEHSVSETTYSPAESKTPTEQLSELRLSSFNYTKVPSASNSENTEDKQQSTILQNYIEKALFGRGRSRGCPKMIDTERKIHGIGRGSWKT